MSERTRNILAIIVCIVVALLTIAACMSYPPQ